MDHDELLNIGAFSLLSGLSITALRHYDEIDLLPPADVDQSSGYRRYRREQLHLAWTIRALRGVEMPVGAVRTVVEHPERIANELARHRDRLEERVDVLTSMVQKLDHYISQGVIMSNLTVSRIVQVTINVSDRAAAIAFYWDAFGAEFHDEISSFQFGTWPNDHFFLLTVAGENHDGPAGASRFGLTVDDVDEAHRRALAAGAVEQSAPYDSSFKPRTSTVIDPSGNRIDLYQG
jgi:DNA-binding transcriptional MerR regulator